jgi:hypothetical protein
MGVEECGRAAAGVRGREGRSFSIFGEVLADLTSLERWEDMLCIVVEAEDDETHCGALADSPLLLL